MDEVSTEVIGGSPAADTGASTPVADAPVSTEGLSAGSGAGVAPAPEPAPLEQQPDGGAPATPLTIPQDDSDLEGPNAPQGVEAIREMRRAIRERDDELAQFRQTLEPIQQWGGPEVVQQGMQLMSELFRPATDPATGQPLLDQYGIPQVDPRGFVNLLAQESSGTLLALGDALLEASLPNGRPVIDVIVRDVFGLNPDLMDTYRQISSPQAAAGMGLLGDITPEELEEIPAQYHKAYQAMTSVERENIARLDEATRNMFLKNANEALESRQFRQQQLQQQQAAAEAQFREQQIQVQRNGYQLAYQTRQQHETGLKSELAKIQFSADPTVNQRLQERVFQATAAYVDYSPEIQPLAQQTERMYSQVAQLEANNDKFRASQLKIAADQNAQRIFAKARIYAMESVKDLQSLAGGQSGVNGQQNTARPVIAGQNGLNTTSSQGSNSRAPFSPESIRIVEEIVNNLPQSQGGRQGW